MSYRPRPQGPSVRRRLSRSATIAALAIVSALSVGSAAGHDFGFTEVSLVLRPDATFQANMQLDLDALALGVAPDSDDAELVAVLAGLPESQLAELVDDLRSLLERRVRVLFDGVRADVRIEFPDRAGLTRNASPPTFLGVRAWLAGTVPADAEHVSFRASRAFAPVQLSILDERSGATAREPLARGDESTPFALDPASQQRAPVSSLRASLQYARLGFLHIIPAGLDHMLFVLGLFLLSARLRPLLLQVSAFTLAHTVTLALSALGVVQLPASIVEPLIALSIAYVGIENAITDRLHSWRPMLVFAFGLLHGLGFAGVLGEIGLPQDQALSALLGFNIGVELGQLAFVAAVVGPVLLLRRAPDWAQKIPAYGIGTVAAAWTIERVLGFFGGG